ncbi:hypothetical protein EZV62_013305 [Acer yangbiense]|uniref:Uncharacterized protein n=1 Tax=Acer yangbiense TaxID=1000413 RepID=A0A5C7I0L7_9ROSI|nr:hypothetical protein EZV62_013305 [Acer yangbiense]
MDNKDSFRSISRERTGGDVGLLRTSSENNTRQQTTSSEFVLQWGNRKRLRCMKVQVKDDSTGPAHRTTVRVVRTDKDPSNQPTTTATTNTNHHGNGYFNLLECTVPGMDKNAELGPLTQLKLHTCWIFMRLMFVHSPIGQVVVQVYGFFRRTHGDWNSENSSAMRGQSNGGARGFASPDRGGGAGASSETAHDSKKGGSSSASGEAVAPPVVWPPKFAIALTNKEKEEDFLAIKGSKLPQRPKKRAKLIQRTVNVNAIVLSDRGGRLIGEHVYGGDSVKINKLINEGFNLDKTVTEKRMAPTQSPCLVVGHYCRGNSLVSPGAWLCDLTLERYEVREKKITKKTERIKGNGKHGVRIGVEKSHWQWKNRRSKDDVDEELLKVEVGFVV